MKVRRWIKRFFFRKMKICVSEKSCRKIGHEAHLLGSDWVSSREIVGSSRVRPER